MSECSSCAHSIEPISVPNPVDPTKTVVSEKGHKDVGGNLVCLQCGEVCKLAAAAPAPAPAAPTPPPAVVQTPSTKELATAVAAKMNEMRDELIWKDLASPGVIIQLVDGGYIITNRWGETAVRMDLEQTMTKAKTWLVPRV